MVLFRSCLLKFAVFLGLTIVFLLRYWPIAAVPSFKDHAFWESLAIIGGIIYLMGAESSHCTKKHESSEKKVEKKQA
jgi:hypothetical protein